MKIPETVFENTQTPGYYLTSKGVVDYNLRYVGYLYDTEHPLRNINEYSFDFKVDWGGDVFICKHLHEQILIVYDKGLIDDDKNHINNFTYKNHNGCFLKIPNNIKVMHDNNLINVKNFTLSHLIIKSILLLSEVSLIIHNILLELIRLNYDNYKEIIQSPMNEHTKRVLEETFR